MDWDLQHQRSSFVIRLLLAAWILVIIVLLCASGRWWGMALALPLALDLYLLGRILVARGSR